MPNLLPHFDARLLGNKYNVREFLALLDAAREEIESDFVEAQEEEDEARLAYVEQPLMNWLKDLLGALEEAVDDAGYILPQRPPKPVPRHHQLYTEPAEESVDEEIMRRLKQ